MYDRELPSHPASERSVKNFTHWSHDLPVTPGLHWHCPIVSFVHTVSGIVPVALHSQSKRCNNIEKVGLTGVIAVMAWVCMYEWMIERTNQRLNEWMNEWMNEYWVYIIWNKQWWVPIHTEWMSGLRNWVCTKGPWFKVSFVSFLLFNPFSVRGEKPRWLHTAYDNRGSKQAVPTNCFSFKVK